MGLSFCLGCEVSKWRLNLFGLILSEPNILRHNTLRSLFIVHRCTGETQGEICLTIFSCLCFGSWGIWCGFIFCFTFTWKYFHKPFHDLAVKKKNVGLYFIFSLACRTARPTSRRAPPCHNSRPPLGGVSPSLKTTALANHIIMIL